MEHSGCKRPICPALFGPLIAADFNGDGKLDVASGFFRECRILLRYSRGAAIFFNLSHPAALLSVVSAADFSDGASLRLILSLPHSASTWP